MIRNWVLVAGAGVVLLGCRESRAASPPAAHPPTHVDSILPRDEALRRFKQGTRATEALSGGTTSRDALVRAFVSALAARDTARLGRLALDRDEFAYLYYPTTPQGRPPYDLAPDLMWFTLQTGSDKGLGRALEANGGRSLRLASYHCDPMPSREGENLVWGPCVVRYRVDGRLREARLFGLILERQGRFKFVSYGNRL